jgi:DNA-binding PucR family transcriptional regulator
VLLAGLPNQVVKWFAESADALHGIPIHLNDELREAMMGLISANLNVSEAARTLYVHRNTLINRLERIRESSGYDLRDFDDALVLWLRLTLGEDKSSDDPNFSA